MTFLLKIGFRFIKHLLPNPWLSFFVFFACIGMPTLYAAEPTPSVWDVLRGQFVLNHEVGQAEVQQQIHWLVAHPGYLHQLAKSEPYIYHIVTEIKKRNMPGEIALIPMIESAYDPFAYSGAGAAGLWQFMPGTGTDLGLKQDWWFDARRSIGPSTTAALNYLLYLHQFFEANWILAFAAYDCGEGTIARAIKNSHQALPKVHFWSLPVPNETKAYVPRLLALAEIIQNPARYHVVLPHIPHQPYFKEVNMPSAIDLNHAAKLAGISYHEMIQLNPGFNRFSTNPYRPYKLLIPVSKVDNFNRNLAHLPDHQRVEWAHHQVSAGDDLQIIAEKYHTTVEFIQALNQMKSSQVKKGQVVLVPNQTKLLPPPHPSTAKVTHKILHFATPKQLKVIHIVARQDTYEGILARYHVSANQLQRWNHLRAQDKLRPGQSLIIWRAVSEV